MGLIQHGDQAFVDDASHRAHCGTCYREEIDRLRDEAKVLKEHLKASRDENAALKAKADSAGELVLKMDIRLLKVEEENAKLREALKFVATRITGEPRFAVAMDVINGALRES